MLKSIAVPDVLGDHMQIGHHDISFVYYIEATPQGRNLISFSSCAISLLLTGQKELYRGAERTLVNSNEGIIIPNGNAIIAERTMHSECYSSLVAFFPINALHDFMKKADLGVHNLKKSQASSKIAFMKFALNPYLAEYARNITGLIEKRIPLAPAMVAHKLEELFLVLFNSNPDEFIRLVNSYITPAELKLRSIIEGSLGSDLTLHELAFLANRSLASFKRDFEKLYHTSPGKYLQKRKLEMASHALQEGKQVMEIALQLGYDNVSNFNTAFKKEYGQSPKTFQSTRIF